MMPDYQQLKRQFVSKWGVITNPNHVYPLCDLCEHEINGRMCWCNPKDDDGVLVHNSLDCRETYERGRKAT